MLYPINDSLPLLGKLVRDPEPPKQIDYFPISWVSDSRVTDSDKAYLDDDEVFQALCDHLLGQK